jgi:hypothetical protein
MVRGAPGGAGAIAALFDLIAGVTGQPAEWLSTA